MEEAAVGRASFKCSYCEKTFNRSTNRQQHEKRIHLYTLDDLVLEKPTKKKKKISKTIESSRSQNSKSRCAHCSKNFSAVRHRKRHETDVHGVQHLDTRTKATICQECNITFRQLKEYREHVVQAHNAVIDSVKYEFGSEEEFNEWKGKLEMDVGVNYTAQSGPKKALQGSKQIYYCQRSGIKKMLAQGSKHAEKSQGTCKIGQFCTSSVDVLRIDGRVHVTYFVNHRGHNLDFSSLIHMKLPTSGNDKIAGPGLNKKRKRKDVESNPSSGVQLCEDITKVKVEAQSEPEYDTKNENGDRKEHYLDSVESQDLEENLGLQFKMEMEVSDQELIPEYEENEKALSPNEEITINDSDRPVAGEVDDHETNGKAQDSDDVTKSGDKNSGAKDGTVNDDGLKKGKLPPMLLIKGPNQSQFVLVPSSSSSLVCPPVSVGGQSLLQSSQTSVAKNTSDPTSSTPKSLASLPVKIKPVTSLIPIELPGGQKCLIAPTNVCLAPVTPTGLPKPKYSSATSSTVSVKNSVNFPSVHTHFIQPSKFKSILPKKTQSVPTTSVQTKPVKTVVQISSLGQVPQQQSKQKKLLNGNSVQPPDMKNSKSFIGKQVPSHPKPPMVMMGQKSILLAPSNVKGVVHDSVVMSVSPTIPTATTTPTAAVANNSVVLKVPVILDNLIKPKMKLNDYTQVSKSSPVALTTKPSSSITVTSSTIHSATSTTNSLTTPLVIKGGSLMLSKSENGHFPVVLGKGNCNQTLSSLGSANKDTSSYSLTSVAKPATSLANTENEMDIKANESNSNIVVTIQKNLEAKEQQKLSKMMSRMNYLERRLDKAKKEIRSFKLSSSKILPDRQLQRLRMKRGKGEKVSPATQSFLVASRVNAPGQAKQPSLLIPLVNNSGLNRTHPSQIADVMVNHGSGRSSPPLIVSSLMSKVGAEEASAEAEWGDETKPLRDDNLFMQEAFCRELKTEPIDCVPEIEFEEEEITDPVGIT